MIAMEVLLNPSDHELRYRVKKMEGLYDKRSSLVHTGDRSPVTREDVLRLRHYVREAIKEVMRAGISKDDLLKALNTCGFGERPWRKTT
jgi:hypothetical protein